MIFPFVAVEGQEKIKKALLLNIVNKKNDDILDKDIEELIQKRADAKKNKDFKLADEIRQELLDKGIVLEDTRQGTKWKRV